MAYALTLGTVSFLLAVIWGKPLILLLKRLGIGKQIRVEEPDVHQLKTGTPTMGGILIVVPVLLITGVLNIANLWGLNTIGQSTLILFFCLGSFAILGAIDDWQGIKGDRGRGEGMSPRMKSGFQVLFATLIALVLYLGPPQWDYMGVPGFPDFFRIGPLIIPVTVLIIVGTSNAVNLTDGLDSLAGSISSIAFACYGTIAYLQNQTPLVLFCFTVVGALLAFLWYNAHPAQMFMGDTGSLTIGGIIAVIAIAVRKEWLIPLLCGIFLAENLSVVMQVSWFRYTRKKYGEGRRIFKMSPLHHHYQKSGYHESKIVTRFWIVGILLAILTIVTLKIR